MDEFTKINIKETKKGILLLSQDCFSLPLTLDCGQAFRWKLSENGKWEGVAFGRFLRIYEAENGIFFEGTSKEEFCSLWKRYFDLERDYSALLKKFSGDDALRGAVSFCSGIRVLRQEPWETLCSFIISQNNNIPRIKGIIERLCDNFGEQIPGGMSFPSAERLNGLTIEALAPLRAGFRAKYILDAAQKVTEREVDFEKIEKMSDDEAREELMKIKGVGKKVADCTLLYGFGRLNVYPVDVWVGRILEELYPNGLPECTEGFKGIAQQYLFHWRRNRGKQDN